jgi:hypothetical protein
VQRAEPFGDECGMLRGNCRCTDDPERTGEHREAGEQVTFQWVEQFDRPVDRGPQSLLSTELSATAAGQEGEAVVESAADLAQAHRASASGRQFDRKREPIETPADCGDLLELGWVRIE